MVLIWNNSSRTRQIPFKACWLLSENNRTAKTYLTLISDISRFQVSPWWETLPDSTKTDRNWMEEISLRPVNEAGDLAVQTLLNNQGRLDMYMYIYNVYSLISILVSDNGVEHIRTRLHQTLTNLCTQLISLSDVIKWSKGSPQYVHSTLIKWFLFSARTLHLRSLVAVGWAQKWSFCFELEII